MDKANRFKWSYSERICALARKYRQFFSDGSPGQILAMICPYTFELDYAGMGLPDRGLDSWDYAGDMRGHILYSVRRLRAFLEYTKDLDNDYVPALNVNFGYGAHSAYFTGQPVIMGADTSWTKPFLTSWERLPELRMDENSYWFQKIMEGYRLLCEFCDGDYAISAFCNAGPGDMANAIRGNDLFYDLYDEPENVHALMDKCADAAIWLESEIAKAAGPGPECAGCGAGSVTANVWMPGAAPYISEDFNDLCPLEMYAEFGFAHTQKIIDRFGGAFIHHHAKGRHIHGKIAALRGLRLLEISLDPNCPRPVDELPGIFEEHGGLPLMIRCHARDVYGRMDDLKRGRAVLMLNIDSLEEGREAMRFIRRHSII
ncbi:MAG: uroporphyrinogen decarboxylase family protein [Clostridiales bacterium]|nr:uroporphyrinogen decarboxylase family protein [Clostridiales bacterium]